MPTWLMIDDADSVLPVCIAVPMHGYLYVMWLSSGSRCPFGVVSTEINSARQRRGMFRLSELSA